MNVKARRCSARRGDLENVIAVLDCFQTRRREVTGVVLGGGELRKSTSVMFCCELG
jgi:hypothetical protein